MLELSIAHIKPEDKNWLSNSATAADMLIFDSYEYGFYINSQSFINELLPINPSGELLPVPKAICEVLNYAHSMGCDWIRLDQLGDILEDLPNYMEMYD